MAITAYPQLGLLPVHALEESTYMINVAFSDEDGSSVTPKSRIAWILNALISSTLSVIATGSTAAVAAIDIILSGDDLAMQTNERNYGLRLFDVITTYDSSLGANLPLKAGVKFIIDNLAGIA